MVKRNYKILQMVQMAVLIALIIVLQTVATGIKIGGVLPLSFVLVPIVMGACLFGPKAGALLGFVFGAITAIMGIFGFDLFSKMLFEDRPFWFTILCLLKAIMAGFGSGLIYKALEKPMKNAKTLRTVIASISAPIINTGIFCAGMLIFFFNTMNSILPAGYENAYQFLFLVLAGLNFVGEFLINLVLSPVIVRVVDALKNKYNI